MKRAAETSIDQLKTEVEETKDEPKQDTDEVQMTNRKVRIAMIVGYNGINFHGSQKNKGVRTVEEEIENALFKNKLIAKHNYGDLSKIAFSRATRTDKSVHALQNCFSCKIQFDDKGKDFQDSYEPMRLQLNKLLPTDVKIFCVQPVSQRFDAKNATSHREYSYFLPTYMLTPIKELLLESPPKEATLQDKEGDAKFVTQMSGGIKRILRRADSDDEIDNADKFLDRDMSHITEEMIQKMFSTRLSAEQKEQVERCWKSFIGTKKYHNYTKDVKAHQMAAQRYMIEMEASEFRYVNRTTLKVTDSSDPEGIEFVRFYLKGQSFLYNQIRKMVGCMIQVFHGMLGEQFVENTHKDNVMQVAIAPGDGLLCEKVAYDKYNELPTTHEPVMVKLKVQKLEIDHFRDEILQYIAEREIKKKAFMCWLTWFDDNRNDYYIEHYKPKTDVI